MHQAQASSTTSLTNDNCSSLDIKPSIQQNGGSNPSSGQKQREGTTTSALNNNSGNTNTNNNNNNNSNANSNNNSNNNNNSSLNGGLFDNPQSAYGSSTGATGVGGYDSSYHGYHQSANAAFQSLSLGNGNTSGGANAIGGGGGGGGGAGTGGVSGIRSNMSPHHHHHSAKPHRTKPRTSAGKKHNNLNRHGVGLHF